MADQINFVLALIDKISAPAKAASVALSALETQLKSVQALLKDMPKLALKVPKLAGEGAARASERVAKNAPMHGPVEQVKAQFGPSRKEAEKAARYRERLAASSARESARVVKQLAKQEERDAISSARESARVVKQLAKQEERDAISAAKTVERQATQASRAAAQIKRKQIADATAALKRSEKQTSVAAQQAQRQTVGFHLAKLKQAKAESAACETAEKQLAGPQGFFKTLASDASAAAAALGPVGIAMTAVAGAALLAGGGIAYLVGKTAGLAIEAAEAKQDTLDMLEAMLGSADAAQRTLGAIRDITKVTSASQEAVQDSAAALSAAGIKNEKLLTNAVKSVAQVESVLKGKGEKIQAVFEKAAQTGKFEVNAKKLAGTGVQIQSLYAEIAKRTGTGVKTIDAQLKAGKIKAETGIDAMNAVISQKFGAVAAKQAKDIGPQLQRFHDNVSRLFEDIDTSPFLDALDRIITLFDTATPSGAAMHDVLTSVFDGLFKAVSYVEPYVKTFLKGLVIIALQVAIAFKPLMKSIRAAFGGESQSGPMRLAEIMSLVGLGLNKLITFAIKLSPVFGVIWSVVSTVTGVMFSLATTLMFGIPKAIGYLVAAVVLAVGWFAQFGQQAVEAGGNVVTGLIDGIKGAAGKLYDTVVNLATTALDKFKSIFQMHSPSRVMAGLGVNITAGLAQGIHAGARASTGAMAGAGAGMAAHAAAGARTSLMSFAGPQMGVSSMLGQRHLTGNDNAYTPTAAAPARLAEPRGSRATGGPAVLHMAPGAVVIQLGSGGVAELEEKFPEMMANWWEQASLANGSG